MKKTDELPEDVRQIQEASDAATWDAIEAYRDTGEMVPVAQDGKLAFLTVDEALRSRPDYDRRKRETAAWRLKNLRDQFAAGGVPLVIHNIGAGTQEENVLFEYPLTGHYRLP